MYIEIPALLRSWVGALSHSWVGAQGEPGLAYTLEEIIWAASLLGQLPLTTENTDKPVALIILPPVRCKPALRRYIDLAALTWLPTTPIGKVDMQY